MTWRRIIFIAAVAGCVAACSSCRRSAPSQAADTPADQSAQRDDVADHKPASSRFGSTRKAQSVKTGRVAAGTGQAPTVTIGETLGALQATHAPTDVPDVALDPNGALGSVTWRTRQLIARAQPGTRPPLVGFAQVVETAGGRALFRTRQTGSDVSIRVEPVENGIDLHVTTVGRGVEDVHLNLGTFATTGQARVLLPKWAGTIVDVVFPRVGGPVYRYPGEAFAPVCAVWDDDLTVGYAALAQVGDFVKLQLRKHRSSDRGASMHVILVGACQPNDTRQYEITIRFAEGAAQWRDALEPYRTYQHQRDGPVRYERLGPWVCVNMRNLHAYDFHGTRNYKQGSTWENTLGRKWDWALRAGKSGNLAVGCIGVWAQMEQVDPKLAFNPDALDLEKSLAGSLPSLLTRIRREYGPVHISGFSRPGRKIVNGAIVNRDFTDPTEWSAMMAQLQGLADLGFDMSYGDELGIHGGWEAVDLVEQAPLRLIPEWAWDRMLTRASCLMAHPKFPGKDAALLVPYLTPGGELYVKASVERRALFYAGAVTPWEEWVGDHNRMMWNDLASHTRTD